MSSQSQIRLPSTLSSSWNTRSKPYTGKCHELDSIVSVDWRPFSQIKYPTRQADEDHIIEQLHGVEFKDVPFGAIRIYSISPIGGSATLHNYPVVQPQPRVDPQEITFLNDYLTTKLPHSSSESNSQHIMKHYKDFSVNGGSEIYTADDNRLGNSNDSIKNQMRILVERDQFMDIPVLTRIAHHTNSPSSSRRFNGNRESSQSRHWDAKSIWTNTNLRDEMNTGLHRLSSSKSIEFDSEHTTNIPLNLELIDSQFPVTHRGIVALPAQMKNDDGIFNLRVPSEPYKNQAFSSLAGNTIKLIDGHVDRQSELNLDKPTHRSVIRLRWSRKLSNSELADTSALSEVVNFGSPSRDPFVDAQRYSTHDIDSDAADDRTLFGSEAGDEAPRWVP
ncbi:uncharacterized protein L201_003211 [Kwoniella dendrophila CBS 6074]|uniref:Uncharacterized protein n=1 Tax=Kwoniella dendrophila CBS 6074 TaxID=1295534 RepID=A0AAX4JUW4_9TREE